MQQFKPSQLEFENERSSSNRGFKFFWNIIFAYRKLTETLWANYPILKTLTLSYLLTRKIVPKNLPFFGHNWALIEVSLIFSNSSLWELRVINLKSRTFLNVAVESLVENITLATIYIFDQNLCKRRTTGQLRSTSTTPLLQNCQAVRKISFFPPGLYFSIRWILQLGQPRLCNFVTIRSCWIGRARIFPMLFESKETNKPHHMMSCHINSLIYQNDICINYYGIKT